MAQPVRIRRVVQIGAKRPYWTARNARGQATKTDRLPHGLESVTTYFTVPKPSLAAHLRKDPAPGVHLRDELPAGSHPALPSVARWSLEEGCPHLSESSR